MIRKSGWLKYMRDQKLTAFIPSASLLSSLPLCLPLHLFHLLLCSEQVLKCWTWKKKDEEIQKEKKNKNLSYILFNVFATLQPSQRFLIQIQFSSCFYPHPLPLLLPLCLTPHMSLSFHPSSFSFPIMIFLLSHFCTFSSLHLMLSSLLHLTPDFSPFSPSLYLLQHERLPVCW